MDPRLLPEAIPRDPGGALRFLLGKLEPAITLGTGMAGQAAGGLAGLGQLIAGQGSERAAGSVQGVSEGLTFIPRTPEGEQGLAGLLGVSDDVGTTIADAAPVLSPERNADAVFDFTGSPLAAALTATTAPQDVLPSSLRRPGRPQGPADAARPGRRATRLAGHSPGQREPSELA